MRFDRLLVNARIATMTATGRPWGALEDMACLGIADGRIAWAGVAAELDGPPERRAREVVDCRGGWLTPGLVDCHTHLVFAGNRARDFAMRLEGADRAAILAAGGGIPSTVRATRAASGAELLASALPRLDELLAEGVTTVEIKSGYGLERATELRQLRVARRLGELRPVRVVTSYLGMHGLAPEYAGRADAYVDLVCEELLPEAVAQGLVDAVDGAIERVAFNAAQMARVFRKAQQLGRPVKAHADQYADAGGAAAVAGFRGLSADHLECVSAAGIAAMAEAGTVATLLPGANYTLRDPHKPPVDKLREAGVAMALATNCNPGSSPTTSPLLMMNMACSLFGMTAGEALAGFTVNAAKALGLQDEIGTIAPGRRADLALWDVDEPAELAYWLGRGSPLAQLFRNGTPLAPARWPRRS
ncbi:imidazolonepropionase [Geminicoccaceae bacterium 1502E]|nr:imidazolonepropionase [Geminicoccaceae bacterium 1502E]